MLRPGQFEGIAHDPLTARTADQLEALEHIISLAMLNPGVEVFLIFAHDDHVHLRKVRRHIGRVGQAGPHICIEPQGLAQCHIQAFHAATQRRGDRRFEQQAGCRDVIPSRWRDSRSVASAIKLLAQGNLTRGQSHSGSLQHGKRHSHDFGPDAVAVGNRNFQRSNCGLRCGLLENGQAHRSSP